MFLLFFFSLFLSNIFTTTSKNIEIGESIIPNQCSSLGKNNPLETEECTMFDTREERCCMLSVTKEVEEEEEDSVVINIIKVSRTACIILKKGEKLKDSRKKYKESLSDSSSDVMIECGGRWMSGGWILWVMFGAFVMFFVG